MSRKNNLTTNPQGAPVTDKDADLLELVLAGPKLPVEGVLGEVGHGVVRTGEIARTLIGKMKVAGFSLGEIFSVLILIGKFIAEHEDDIDAIWKLILSLFPNKQVS